MFPKAYVLTGFLQDDWRVPDNLTLNLGLRYDVEIDQEHSRLAGAGRQEQRRSPRSASRGIRRATRSGRSAAASAASRSSTPIFTIVKGGVGGRNGLVTLTLTPADPLFPTFPNALPAFPPGAVLPPRDIQEISPDARERARVDRRASASSASSGARTSVAIDANINRGAEARVPRHERAGADSEGRR